MAGENEQPQSDISRSRKRKVKFSDKENEILVAEYFKRKNILRGSVGSTFIKSDKDKAWNEIINAVNSVCEGKNERNKLECEIRMKNIITPIKKKVSAFQKDCRKTGGGKNGEPALSTFEKLVMGVVGKESVLGIKGLDFTATQISGSNKVGNGFEINYIGTENANQDEPEIDSFEKELLELEKEKLKLKRERISLEEKKMNELQAIREILENIANQ